MSAEFDTADEHMNCFFRSIPIVVCVCVCERLFLFFSFLANKIYKIDEIMPDLMANDDDDDGGDGDGDGNC